MSNHFKAGENNVFIGNISGEFGDGNVVIGATDHHGNTIINQPMAIGRGASAGPGSIAIGAFANAGGTQKEIQQLELLILSSNDQQVINAYQGLIAEVKDTNDQQKKLTFWDIIERSAAVIGHIQLLQTVKQLFGI